jgi:hypothetical protein
LFHICELNFVSSWLPIWTHPPWIALTNLFAIHGMMGVCSRFKIWRLLSQLLWMIGIAQHWKGCSFHKRKLPTSCPNLVFLAKFNPLGNGTCWKLRMLLFVDLLKPYVLFVGGVKFWAPSTWNVEVNFPSTKGFNVSTTMSYVHPFGIWVSTSTSFNGGGTSLPHWANNVFTHGYAFEHIATLVCPLPSYQ